MKRIIMASLLAASVCAAPAFAREGVKVGVCCGGCLAKANKASGDDRITLLFKSGKGFKPASD